MAGPTHKLFLDDSGNKDYSPDGRYGNRGGRTPYFVFGGMLLTPPEAGMLDLEMGALKMETFGTKNVEIKAHWLRRSQERKARYLEKFGVSEADLVKFSESVYQLMGEADCQLVACAVNKAEVAEQYSKPNHPAGIAYECVLQRAQQEMIVCDGEIHVTIDTMTGATPAGNQHLAFLQRQHALLKRRGSQLQGGMDLDRIGGLAFRDSALDERLQLSDLVAYAVYRQFVDYGPDWEEPSKTLPLYEYLGRVIHKFRTDRRGRVQGYGIIKFPKNRHVPWGITRN